MSDSPTAERVRVAARRLFEAEGAAGVTMRRVARELGLTPMALYRHFPSRDSLLARVADDGFAELARRWQPGKRRAPRARLLELLDGYLDFALEQPRIFDYMFAAARPGARRFPEDFQARRSPTANLLADLVGEAMARGELAEDDVWAVGMTLWAQAHGLIVLHQGGRFGLDAAGFRGFYRASLERVIHGLAA